MFPQTIPVPDSMLLGITQEQSGSELQAGARAELLPSPLTNALSSVRGRIVARTMLFLVNEPLLVNFTKARIPVLQAAIKRHLPKDKPQLTMVTVGVGFSPLGIWLAEENPNLRVIECDLPEVIRKRKARLRRAPDVHLPLNVQEVGIDFRKSSVDRVLAGARADVFDFTGAYFTHAQLENVARYLYMLLDERGFCSCYLPWQPGLDRVREAGRFFRNQVGEFPGIVGSEDTIQRIFHAAGFQEVNVLYPSVVGRELGLETPILDAEVIVIARRMESLYV
ncbi:MAG: hypothetical protein OHK0046_19780 [Anaerolineae bacterium]